MSVETRITEGPSGEDLLRLERRDRRGLCERKTTCPLPAVPDDHPHPCTGRFPTSGQEHERRARGAAASPRCRSAARVQHDFIVCLEDGKKLKMLKRYLRSRYDLSPDDYRRAGACRRTIRWWRRPTPRGAPTSPRRSASAAASGAASASARAARARISSCQHAVSSPRSRPSLATHQGGSTCPSRRSCHCGATQFEVSEPPASVTQCTCCVLFQAWGVARLLHARSVQADHRARPGLDLPVAFATPCSIDHCSICGCPTYGESPDFSTGVADFSKPRIGVNARLFDDFDLDAVEVVVVDGKNLLVTPADANRAMRSRLPGRPTSSRCSYPLRVAGRPVPRRNRGPARPPDEFRRHHRTRQPTTPGAQQRQARRCQRPAAVAPAPA